MNTLLTHRIGNFSLEYHPEGYGMPQGGTLFFIINSQVFTWLPQSELAKLGEFITACSQQRDTNLENSLPLVDEEDEDTDEFDYDGWYPEHVLEVDDLEFDDRIPLRGEPTPYNDDNNISPAAIGLEPAA